MHKQETVTRASPGIKSTVDRWVLQPGCSKLPRAKQSMQQDLKRTLNNSRVEQGKGRAGQGREGREGRAGQSRAGQGRMPTWSKVWRS